MIAGTLLGGSELVLSVKARLDYEPLFSILDGLRPDAERRYWIERLEAQGDYWVVHLNVVDNLAQPAGAARPDRMACRPASRSRLNLPFACLVSPSIEYTTAV
jgi:hypothetical protein